MMNKWDRDHVTIGNLLLWIKYSNTDSLLNGSYILPEWPKSGLFLSASVCLRINEFACLANRTQANVIEWEAIFAHLNTCKYGFQWMRRNDNHDDIFCLVNFMYCTHGEAERIKRHAIQINMTTNNRNVFVTLCVCSFVCLFIFVSLFAWFSWKLFSKL